MEKKDLTRRDALRLGAVAAAGAVTAATAAPAAARQVQAQASVPPGQSLGHEDRMWDSPEAWSNPEPVDLLLYNGQLVTVDDRFSIAEALAVKNGLIVAVGPDSDLRARFTGSQEINLNGQTVLPGFNDCHSHNLTINFRSIGDLQLITSIARLQELLAAKADELGPGEWIIGSGYDETLFAEGRINRFDLDEATPNNPVVLTRQGSHSSVANSLALQIAGITSATPDPPNGHIERDENGEPTGVLVEGAQSMVRGRVPSQGAAQNRAGAIQGMKAYLPLGITTFSQKVSSVGGFRTFQSYYEEQGEDLPRSHHYINSTSGNITGVQPFEGDNRVRASGVKLFADGGFTGPDARLSLPYRNVGDGTFRGTLRRTPNQFLSFFRNTTSAGWPAHIHTAGDGAEAIVIDAIAKVLSEMPGLDIRHALTHFEVQLPDEWLGKAAQFGIGVEQQTNYLYSLEGLYDNYLWPVVREDVVPVRSLLSHGIRVANSADVIPTGPMLGLYTTVTRRGRKANKRYAYNAEAVSIQEAIRMYTMGGAYSQHQEDVKGSLEPGKLADFVVLSHDILRVVPDNLLGVRVNETWVNGKLVYERPQDQRPSTEGSERLRPSGGREPGPGEVT